MSSRGAFEDRGRVAQSKYAVSVDARARAEHPQLEPIRLYNTHEDSARTANHGLHGSGSCICLINCMFCNFLHSLRHSLSPRPAYSLIICQCTHVMRPCSPHRLPHSSPPCFPSAFIRCHHQSPCPRKHEGAIAYCLQSCHLNRTLMTSLACRPRLHC